MMLLAKLGKKKINQFETTEPFMFTIRADGFWDTQSSKRLDLFQKLIHLHGTQ